MTDDRIQLRKAMGEAASLPPEDIIRRNVEASISSAGQWAEKEWLEILSQDEHFRIALRKFEVPSGLKQKLLAIPDQKFPKPKVSRQLSLKYLAYAVAAALIAATVAVIIFSQKEPDLNQIAMLAINDHINNRNLKIVTNDPEDFKNKITGLVPFEVNTPDFGGNLKLSGGRPCKLGSHPIVYSLWNKANGEFSLFQFRLADFGLSNMAESKIVKPQSQATKNEKSECLIWSKGSFGYILIGEDEESLNEIALRLKGGK